MQVITERFSESAQFGIKSHSIVRLVGVSLLDYASIAKSVKPRG